MNYIGGIFSRADIQQIGQYLLHGTEQNTTDPRPYRERIESAHDAFVARLRKEHPENGDFEEISESVYNYVCTVEEVYMEIGLQVGAMLAIQAVQNIKKALEGK